VIKTLPESLKMENCNLRSKRKITEKRQNGVESIPTRPKDTVRVELFKNQDRTIKSFFDDIDKKSTSIDNNDKKSTSIDNNDKKSTSIVVKDKKSISKRFDPKSDLSFQEWLSNLKMGRDERVSKILKNFVYVGDINGYLMLIQCGKKLLSLNLKPIFKVLLKQNFLANRKNADILRWEKPLVVEEEISSYLSKKKRRKGKDQSRPLSRKMCSLLVAKRTQLRKVGITISEKGALESIPDLLPEMEILKERTGKFLGKMAEEAREDPKFGQSLESLDRILSFFWILYLSKDEGISANASRDTFMKSVLVPKVRKVYPLATFLDDKTFVQISSLDRFYSSFERC
ncbi:DNA mismatch repair protein, partial [Bonamia ostreae]